MTTQKKIEDNLIGPKSSKNLCLFAHFDKHNVIDDYVLRYLKSIRDSDFDIILISTSKLNEAEIGKCKNVCRAVIIRSNLGLDFGSWAEGYKSFAADYKNGHLLLSNDSVYGPVGQLEPIIHYLRLSGAHFAGLVESIQSGRHFQSWFLLFSPEAHSSIEFRQVISQDFTKMDKGQIILRGEIGLTRAMREAGFDLFSAFTVDKEADSKIGNFNPMHSAWLQVIRDFKIPFIKVELLRDNPLNIYNISDWRNIVSKESPDLVLMIDRHLRRTALRPNSDNQEKPSFLSAQCFLQRDLSFRQQNSNIRRKLNEIAYVFLAVMAKSAIVLRRKMNKFIEQR